MYGRTCSPRWARGCCHAMLGGRGRRPEEEEAEDGPRQAGTPPGRGRRRARLVAADAIMRGGGGGAGGLQVQCLVLVYKLHMSRIRRRVGNTFLHVSPIMLVSQQNCVCMLCTDSK